MYKWLIFAAAVLLVGMESSSAQPSLDAKNQRTAPGDSLRRVLKLTADLQQRLLVMASHQLVRGMVMNY